MADSLYQHATSIMRTDYDQAKERGKLSLDFAIQSDNELYEVKSLFLLAWLEKKQMNYQVASTLYFQIISKQPNLKLSESKKIVLSAYKNLSYILSYFDEFDLALTLNHEGFLLAAKDLKDSTLMIKYLRPQLTIYSAQEDYFNCLKLAEHMLRTYNIEDEDLKDEVEYFKAMSHQKLGNIELALVLFQEILDNPTTNAEGIADALHQTSLIYLDKGFFKKALSHSNRAAEFNRKAEDYTGLMLNYSVLAHSYAGLTQYNTAISYFESMVKLTERHSINDNYKFEIIPLLIETLQKTDDSDKILLYQEKYRLVMNEYYETRKLLNEGNELMEIALMKVKMNKLIADRNSQEANVASFRMGYIHLFAPITLLLFLSALYYFIQIRKRATIMNDLKQIGIESNV